MTINREPSPYYRVTITFTRDQWKTVRQLGKKLGTDSAEATVRTATMAGIDVLTSGWDVPDGYRLNVRLPWPLWVRVRDLARQNGNTNKGEIIAALNHWIETAETKKGEAPA